MFGFSLAFTSPPFRLSPALQLYFAGATTLDSRITFTRADAVTCATYFDSTGRMQRMGRNEFVNSVFAGTAGNIPTSWSITGLGGSAYIATNQSSVPVQGSAVVSLRRPTDASGYRGLQQTFVSATSTAYTVSVWVRVPTGVVAEDLLFYGGTSTPGIATIATAVTLNAQAKDVWVKYTASVTFTVATSVASIAISGGATTGTGCDICAPQFELGSTATTYSATTTAANSGPRFDYDPASPAGVTGGELFANGGFDSDTAWTKSAGWSISGGSAIATNASATSLFQNVLTVGKTYRITFTVVSISSGGFIPFLGGGSLGTPVTVPGTYTYTAICTSNGNSGLSTSASTNGVVDSLSVQEVTFNPRGLLIEESRQNLLLQSRDMTQAAWSKTDVTPARTQVGIDGVANSACLMTEGSAGTAATLQLGAAVTAGSTMTQSIVAKRGNTDWVRFRVSAGADGCDAWFNLNTGAKGTVSALGVATSTSSTITNLGGGWYRLTVTCVPNGTFTQAQMQINSASADASGTRVSGATYIVDCAQLEVGAFATSIIPTTTTALTRAADVATISGANFSSWWNATQGTLVVEFDRPAISAVGLGYNQVIAGATSASGMAADFIGVVCGAGTPAAQRFDLISASVSQASLTYANGTAVTVYKAVGTWIVNDAVGAQNGTLTSPDTALTVPTVDRFFIGHNSGGAQGVSHIRSLRYYNTRLPNAQLQALTA